MYTTALFDLDGTITDPGIGITNSVAYALEKFNISVTDRSELFRFIGPPLHESFQTFYGFSPEDSKRAVSYYREYYGRSGLYEAELYDGIRDTLLSLHTSGIKVVLATSKPELYALQILQHFDLMSLFDRICGSNMDGSRSKKAEVITYALQSFPETALNDIVMIGDRLHDINGAKAVGIDSIGVSYGYGSVDELHQAGATHVISSPKELLSFFA